MAGSITVQANCTNGMVAANLTFDEQGGSANGFNVIVDGNVVGSFNYDPSGTTSVSINVVGDGQAHTISIQDSDDPNCTIATTLTTPNCNASTCQLSLSANEAGSCNAANEVPVEITVDDIGGSAAGFSITVDGAVVGNYSYSGTGSTTIPLNLPGDGMAHNITATDLEDPACEASIDITTTNCNIPCILSDLNLFIQGNGTFTVHEIEVADFEFIPQNVSIQLGDTVRWIWTGVIPHTTTSDATSGEDSWDSGLLNQGSFFDYVVNNEGMHPYYCIPHGAPGGIGMAGSIEAGPAASPCTAEGMVVINISFEIMGGGSEGYEVYVDNQLYGTYSYTGINNEVLIELTGDGESHIIEIRDIEFPSCTIQDSLIIPECNPNEECTLTVTAQSDSICNANNEVLVELEVVNTNTGNNGFNVFIDNILYPASPYDYDMSGTTNIQIALSGNGEEREVVVEDIDNMFCTDTTTITLPQCGPPCTIMDIQISNEGSTHYIEVRDYEFVPANLEAVLGDTILFYWTGVIPHTTTSDVTSGPGSWNSGLLGQGATYQLILTETGDHPYYCIPHGGPGGIGMAGNITILPDCQNGVSNINVSFESTNGSPLGYNVFLDGTPIVGPVPYDDPSGTNSLLISITGDGASHLLTIQDVETPFCAATTPFIAPECEVLCEILDLQAVSGEEVVHTVLVEDFEFVPSVLSVHANETIRFDWTGTIPHTTTSDAPNGVDSWDSGLLGQGATYDLVIQNPGSHPYYCIPHGGPGGIGMAGVIEAAPACENDLVNVQISFSITNGSSGGYNVFLDGIALPGIPFAYDDPSGANLLHIQVPGDGQQHFITVQDTETGFCAATTSLVVPDCSENCSIEELTIDFEANTTHTIEVKDFEFTPQDLNINLGDTVAFIWTGAIPHTTTSDATSGIDSWDSGLLEQGAAFTLLLETPGVHPYYCTPHGGPGGIGMAGSITVQEAGCENGQINASISFSYTAVGSEGYHLYVDGELQSNSPFDYDNNGTTSLDISIAGDGQQHTLIIADVEDESCADTLLFMAPDCTMECSLLSTITQASNCNNEEQVAYQLDISAINGSPSGFDVHVDGLLLSGSPFSYSGDTTSIQMLLAGDGMEHEIIVSDTEEPLCTDTLIVTTPDCSENCAINEPVIEIGLAQIHTVGVLDFEFAPKDITVDAGDLIRWEWTGAIPHTVTSDATSGPDFFNSGLLGQGAVFEHTVQEAGSHPYYCIPHGGPGGIGMAGTITALSPCEDNMLNVNVSFTADHTGISGYNVFLDGVLSEGSPYSYDAEGDHNFTLEVPANGDSYNLLIVDVDLPDCSTQATFSVPDCEDPCFGFEAGFESELDHINLTANFMSTSEQAVEWEWSFGDSNTSNQEAPTHVYDSEGQYEVCLTVTNADGCTDTSCDTIFIGAYLCTPAFSFEEEGLSIQFQDESITTDPITSWNWHLSDGTVLSEEQHPIISFDTLGIYEVCLEIEAGDCVADTCITMDLSAPCLVFIPNFSYEIDTSTLSVQFSDLSTGNPDQWLWGFGDGNTSSLQHPNYTYPDPGTYNVCLLVQNTELECNEAFCQLVNIGITSSTGIVKVSQPLIIYPNPSAQHQHQWSIKGLLRADYLQELSIRMYDTAGRVVHQEQKPGAEVLEVDTGRALESGVYYVEIRSKNAVYRARLVIQ
jgi:plastocyanin/PKD repeat protein